MQRPQLLIAFLMGACLALGSALVVTSGRVGLPEAHAQTAGNNEVVAIVGNGKQQQGQDNLFVIDTPTKRLAVYNLNGNQLNLLFVRNMTFDLKFEQFPDKGPTPSVKDVREKTREEDTKPPKK